MSVYDYCHVNLSTKYTHGTHLDGKIDIVALYGKRTVNSALETQVTHSTTTGLLDVCKSAALRLETEARTLLLQQRHSNQRRYCCPRRP